MKACGNVLVVAMFCSVRSQVIQLGCVTGPTVCCVTRPTVCCTALQRRSLIGLLLATGTTYHESHAQAAESTENNCPTCLGPIDGTLGSCSGIEQCSSSYDDRPSSFVAPWQYDGSQAAAVRQLVSALVSVGATVQQQTTDYIYATAPGTGGAVDLEFLFAPNDNTVALRASVQADTPDAQQLPLQAAFSKLLGSNDTKKLLETVRLLLRWEEVPILRNRQRVLFFGESPFDSFGPVPPPVPDYSRDLLDF